MSLVFAVGSLLALAEVSHGAAARNEGLFITVGGSDRSIGTQEKDRIAETVQQAVKRFRDGPQGSGSEKRIYRIVFDFNPEGKGNHSKDFGACYGLANMLMKLDDDVVAIAFVHGPVTGHSVLPVLACHEIVMSSGDAALGEVEVEGNIEREFYLDVLKARHHDALAPALRLIDPKVRVRQASLLPDKPIWIDVRSLPEKPGALAGVMID